jgi:hypothetical protein
MQHRIFFQVKPLQRMPTLAIVAHGGATAIGAEYYLQGKITQYQLLPNGANAPAIRQFDTAGRQVVFVARQSSILTSKETQQEQKS